MLEKEKEKKRRYGDASAGSLWKYLEATFFVWKILLSSSRAIVTSACWSHLFDNNAQNCLCRHKEMKFDWFASRKSTKYWFTPNENLNFFQFLVNSQFGAISIATRMNLHANRYYAANLHVTFKSFLVFIAARTNKRHSMLAHISQLASSLDWNLLVAFSTTHTPAESTQNTAIQNANKWKREKKTFRKINCLISICARDETVYVRWGEIAI